jgi:archaellum component FlaC
MPTLKGKRAGKELRLISNQISKLLDVVSTKLDSIDTNICSMSAKLNSIDTNTSLISTEIEQIDKKFGVISQTLSMIDHKIPK